MSEKSAKNFRNPTTIERSIIGRCIQITKSFQREMYFSFLVSSIIFFILTLIAMFESALACFIALFFAIFTAFLARFSWSVLKSYDVTSTSHQIISTQGTWTLAYQGASAKTKERTSLVDGKKITMIVPDMATLPKEGETKNINYEYITIFKRPPLFGYNTIFISIDGNRLTEKHEEYMDSLRPVGLFSIVFSAFFIVSLSTVFVTEFKFTWMLFVIVGLFFVFIRTVWSIMSNNRLYKRLFDRVG